MNSLPLIPATNPRMSISSRPTRKKKMKMPMPEDDVDLRSGVCESGDGPEEDAGGGVGDECVDSESLEDPFEQFGDDDQ